MRIFHIVENLDKGAVENWLVNVFIESRKIKPQWEWTFYCIQGKPGRLDAKVTEAGGKIIYSPCTVSKKLSFLKALRKTLQQGSYDIIHAHHDYLSGFYLLASRGIHFKRRILHIHNTDEALPVGNAFLHKLLLKPFRWLGFYYSDYIVGISQHTLEQFTKKRKTGKKQFRVLYYGIDLKRFEQAADKNSLLEKFSLPPYAKLLLFTGRMNKYKNPVFVVDILNELLQLRNDVYVLFAGEGDELLNVKAKAAAYNIENNIILAGWLDDIASVMKEADAFIFPRLEIPKEGLGLTVVEAQAAGLPLFITKAITEDALIIKELVHCMPINDNPRDWAIEIDKTLSAPLPINREGSLAKMKQSPFELTTATKNLIALYAE